MTMHRRTVPAFLRKTLLSTNRIESILSLVHQSEREYHALTRECDAPMVARDGVVLLEQQFNRVSDIAGIAPVLVTIVAE